MFFLYWPDPRLFLFIDSQVQLLHVQQEIINRTRDLSTCGALDSVVQWQMAEFNLFLCQPSFEPPSCGGCYSHSFGRQQANPEPVHPERVTTHLLGLHALTTVPGLFFVLYPETVLKVIPSVLINQNVCQK